MAELKLPANLKIHFAGAEVMNQFIAVEQLGVRYGLYTAFPFVERMVFTKGLAPIMALKNMSCPEIEIPKYINRSMRHTIQDSGLFTLMFGARGGKHEESLINKWYDKLVEFTLNHGEDVTCVEVDCQKVLGVDKAWEFRERMRKDLKNRIINVFHLEDGKDGLDRLIEFSDYIAISIPELRIAGKKELAPKLVKYIKKKKPRIDIHLLGCTEKNLLHSCKQATSSDSTSYTAGKRYGFIKGNHIKRIKEDEICKLVGEERYRTILKYNNEQNTKCLCLHIEMLKREYENAAGNQDYYQK